MAKGRHADNTVRLIIINSPNLGVHVANELSVSLVVSLIDS